VKHNIAPESSTDRRSKKAGKDSDSPPNSATFGKFGVTFLRDIKKSAEMGYMAMNIIEPPPGCIWGRFNNRILSPEWRDELAAKFANGGLDNCTDIKAIDIGVKKEWLKDADQIVSTSEGCKIEEIPVIQFSETGQAEIANDNLWCFGGNHRRAALHIYIKKLKKDIEQKNQEISDFESGTSGEDTQGDLALLRSALERLTAKVNTDQLWVIRLYDRGAPEETDRVDKLTRKHRIN
jgi:hypothetical protein